MKHGRYNFGETVAIGFNGMSGLIETVVRSDGTTSLIFETNGENTLSMTPNGKMWELVVTDYETNEELNRTKCTFKAVGKIFDLLMTAY